MTEDPRVAEQRLIEAEVRKLEEANPRPTHEDDHRAALLAFLDMHVESTAKAYDEAFEAAVLRIVKRYLRDVEVIG